MAKKVKTAKRQKADLIRTLTAQANKATVRNNPFEMYNVKVSNMNALAAQDPEVIAFKNLLEFIATTIKAVILSDINGNGKIDGNEYFGIVTRLIPSLISGYGDIQAVAKGWKNLDSAEVDIILAYGETIDFLPNDRKKINELIKLIFNIAAYNKNAVSRVLSLIRKDAPADITEAIIDPVLKKAREDKREMIKGGENI